MVGKSLYVVHQISFEPEQNLPCYIWCSGCYSQYIRSCQNKNNTYHVTFGGVVVIDRTPDLARSRTKPTVLHMVRQQLYIIHQILQEPEQCLPCGIRWSACYRSYTRSCQNKNITYHVPFGGVVVIHRTQILLDPVQYLPCYIRWSGCYTSYTSSCQNQE